MTQSDNNTGHRKCDEKPLFSFDDDAVRMSTLLLSWLYRNAVNHMSAVASSPMIQKHHLMSPI